MHNAVSREEATSIYWLAMGGGKQSQGATAREALANFLREHKVRKPISVNEYRNNRHMRTISLVSASEDDGYGHMWFKDRAEAKAYVEDEN